MRPVPRTAGESGDRPDRDPGPSAPDRRGIAAGDAGRRAGSTVLPGIAVVPRSSTREGVTDGDPSHVPAPCPRPRRSYRRGHRSSSPPPRPDPGRGQPRAPPPRRGPGRGHGLRPRRDRGPPAERPRRPAAPRAGPQPCPHRRQRPEHQRVPARRQLQPGAGADRRGAGRQRQHRRLSLGAARPRGDRADRDPARAEGQPLRLRRDRRGDPDHHPPRARPRRRAPRRPLRPCPRPPPASASAPRRRGCG